MARITIENEGRKINFVCDSFIVGANTDKETKTVTSFNCTEHHAIELAAKTITEASKVFEDIYGGK